MERVMRAAAAALISALVVAAWPSGAAAAAVRIVSPRHGCPARFERSVRHALVRGAVPVFDPGERAALAKMGRADLACARRLEFRDERTAERYAQWLAGARAGAVLDSNPQATASDTLEPLQWGVRNRGVPQKVAVDDLTSLEVPGVSGLDIGVDRAPPEALEPAKRVVVAVLDTGVDAEHPDLRTQVLRKDTECQALAQYTECLKKEPTPACDQKYARLDTDGNGYPLDCVGWNVTAGRNPVTGIMGNQTTADDAGHGTHVSGVIAAAVNGLGVRGVARNVAILPVKVIKTSPNQPIRPQADDLPPPTEKDLKWRAGFADVIARGMLYALRSGARVINLSLAWPSGVDSVVMRRMVALARARGVLVVAAAGNDSADSRVLPCQYPGVVCVASHGPDGALSHFSNFGTFVDLAAPGLGILSTWPTGKRAVNFTALDGYELKNGTSMAAPFVAGALARLVGAGIAPDEAVARLLVSARPHQAGAIDPVSTARKYTRTGNADLGAAFTVAPQPLILQAEKEIVKLAWDRKATRLAFSFKLRNLWNPATNVRVHGRLLSARAGLETSDWALDGLDAGAVSGFESALLIGDPRVDGRASLELTVEADGASPRTFQIPLEIVVPVTPAFADDGGDGIEALEIVGEALSPRAELRTVGALDGVPTQDYLAIEDQGQERSLQLLAQESLPDGAGSRYRAGAAVKVPAVAGELLLIQRLDRDGDAKSEYVFVYRLPPPEDSPTPKFGFQFYDSSLRALGQLEYDNKVSLLQERYQWAAIRKDKTRELAPAWIGLGMTPPSEKPAFDPWNPSPKDVPQIRFYYLAADGVHSVRAPEGRFFIQLLTPSPRQSARGEVPVLLGKGDSYHLAFETAVIRDGRVEDSRELALARFRMLAGLDNLISVTSLDPGSTWTGTALAGPAARGALRSTLLLAPQSGGELRTVDRTQRPPAVLDSVMQLSGAFVGEKRQALFAQSHYELLYTDLVSGERASTSLDRFSFLPAFIFGRSFFPVVVGSGDGTSSRLPAILIPALLGLTSSDEVVVPEYDGLSGKLLGLTRPARYRFEAAQGCASIGNPVGADERAPTRLVYFCGSKIVRAALQ